MIHDVLIRNEIFSSEADKFKNNVTDERAGGSNTFKLFIIIHYSPFLTFFAYSPRSFVYTAVKANYKN